MSRLALVAALALLAPRAADACDEFIIESKVFELAARGGILVRFHASPTKGTAYEAPLINKAWKFKLADHRSIRPIAKLLAPGLAVLTLPKGVTAGVLVDGEKRVAELDAIGDEPRLPEPKVRMIVTSATAGKSPTSRTVVEIIGAAPRTAVAIVLANEDGTPITFGMIDPGKPLVAFETRECTLLPEGTVEPTAGMKVTAFWVDQFGRPSPRSVLKRIVKETASPPSKEP